MNNKEQTFFNKDNIIAIVGIIFFAVLVIMVRLSPNESASSNNVDNANGGEVDSLENIDTSNDSESGDNLEDSIFSLLDDKNYHFIYSVEYDGEVEVVEGEVNDSKMKFSITGEVKQEYAKVLDAYLKLENGKYVTTNEEIRPYLKYLDIESLKDILRLSVYEEDDDKITYSIDTTDLLDEYTQLDYSGFEDFKDDLVVITLDKDDKIKSIKIDYSNFFEYVNSKDATFKISMEFDKFGSVGDLGF